MPGRTYNEIFELAADQFGLVTSAQVRDAGINPQSLLMMERRGTARRISHGVYRITHFPESELDHYMEAVLWPLGVSTVISHESALLLYDLSDVSPVHVHVTVPASYRTSRAIPQNLVIHGQELLPHEVTVHNGVPATTVARTIRDCFEGHLGRALLKQAVDEALSKGFISRAEEQTLRNLIGA